MLTREALIRPRTKEIQLEEGKIVIRALRADEAIELRGRDLKGADIFQVIANSIVEPQLSAEDVGQLPVARMNIIVAEVFAFNAMGEKALADAQAELKKARAEG